MDVSVSFGCKSRLLNWLSGQGGFPHGGIFSGKVLNFAKVILRVVTVEFFFFGKFLMSSRPVYLFSCGKLVMRNFFHEIFFLTNNLQTIFCLESGRLFFCITAFLVLGDGEAGMLSFSAIENLPCWAASWIIHKKWLLMTLIWLYRMRKNWHKTWKSSDILRGDHNFCFWAWPLFSNKVHCVYR